MDMENIEWRVTAGLVSYPQALAAMEARAAAIHRGDARECIWLLEHPPLYTAGTSADPAELLSAERFPVFTAGRGGRYTYHGPGQRIVYVMLDLSKRGRDVRHYVYSLEGWLIDSLSELGIASRRAEGRIGIWTDDGADEAKIGAIGVRIRRWVSFHGFALNVTPDLAHFDGIIPCGIAEYPVTSLAKLGITTDMTAVDQAIKTCFAPFLKNLDSGAQSD